jgi:hypothetical protein
MTQDAMTAPSTSHLANVIWELPRSLDAALCCAELPAAACLPLGWRSDAARLLQMLLLPVLLILCPFFSCAAVSCSAPKCEA